MDFEAQVVILAGGFGTRLRSELGNNLPKPMADICGTPLTRPQVEVCKAHGFNKVVVLVHHLNSLKPIIFLSAVMSVLHFLLPIAVKKMIFEKFN